jgi:plastocyanin
MPRTFSLIVAAIMSIAAPVLAYQAEPVVNGGTIEGTVHFMGTPPKPERLEVSKDRDVCGVHPLYNQSLIVGRHDGVANAVVTIPRIVRGKPAPTTNPVFDQKGCEYIPHVLAFMAGSTIEVLNSDGILHSIHTESRINPVADMAQPGFKKEIRVTIKKPEIIKVTCDAHNWMEGWWYATINPYFAVSDKEGHYKITGVPSGTYTLTLWHERLGMHVQPVVVKPGSTVEADFNLPLPKS